MSDVRMSNSKMAGMIADGLSFLAGDAADDPWELCIVLGDDAAETCPLV